MPREESAYLKAYKQLRPAQRQAVDQLDGPVLVIAGPGTGKTQLLATRIAHILATTDALPENILCLTFTDAAAQAMRQRLTNLIGQAAYNVTISTYHAFGSELIHRYPEAFSTQLGDQAADALKIDQLVRQAQAAAPYSNPLKSSAFSRDLVGLFSDYKRALLTPTQVRQIAQANLKFLDAADKLVDDIIGDLPRLTKASIELFGALLTASLQLPGGAAAGPGGQLPPGVQPLAELWLTTLAAAVEAANEQGKTPPIRAWKDRWLMRAGTGRFVAAGRDAARRQLAAADLYEAYLKLLEGQELFDYDDMILRAINGLENNDDLRLNIQERYQYLLLDEFQDTNQAQLRLVQLLTDNPVNGGRPNVLAVGDDDQAIFAFQGANYSHMLEFYKHYQDVLVVPLTENFRSRPEILSLSQQISGQIGTRLHHNFSEIKKDLSAARDDLPPLALERLEFTSDLSQNAWVAEQIKKIHKSGVSYDEIAVLAPRHAQLEALVPFLRQQKLPLRYEKREDVLTDPAIEQLLLMSRLAVALAAGDDGATASLWPQVLSLDCWRLPTSLIWELSWQAAAAPASWPKLLLAEPQTRLPALFFARLGQLATDARLEDMLDYLIGTLPLTLNETDAPEYRSPYRDFYFKEVTRPDKQAVKTDQPVGFWQLLSNLSLLRSRLEDYRPESPQLLKLTDLLDFASDHQAAGIKLLNTNPYQEAREAVQLMTAFKAKGLEFGAVFLLGLNDEIWGSRARGQSSHISLPENLQYIRYAGANEDERLRLLFVALTRAKHQLYLCSYQSSFDGRSQSRLKYLGETDSDDGAGRSPLLPAGQQTIRAMDQALPKLDDVAVYWHDRHLAGGQQPQLRELLQQRLERFQLSASQLNRFTSTGDGPASFLLRDLLKFPGGSSLAGSYGDAVHGSLAWLQQTLNETGQLPPESNLMRKFQKLLASKKLAAADYDQLLERGRAALNAYYAQKAPRMRPGNHAEYDFRNEGVFVGKAHLTGKVDLLEINKTDKTITIVDYKTGRPKSRWEDTLSLMQYRQQLYFYKLLVENSAQFRGYQVTAARLEYVEPDSDGNITDLELKLSVADETHIKALIETTWQHIMDLDFPDISGYAATPKATRQFQQDLLDGTK